MKNRSFILLLCISCTHPSFAQNDFFADIPCFKKVLLDFYTAYEPFPEQKVIIIKKPGGWYVNYLDENNKEQTSLFRRPGKEKYETLHFRKRAIALDHDAMSELPEYTDQLDWQFNFDRCAFFRYDQWSWDVIQYYSKRDLLSERDLESLGRAYALYANGFLANYQYDHLANAGSPFRKELGINEKVPSIRVDSFLYYEDKCIETFRRLAKLNPDYSTLVGNIYTKINNEHMDIYLKLLYLKDTMKANEYLMKCDYPKNILATAYNYFNGLPANSILISHGDNDTYPLWYLQAAKNYRKDVSVLNNSLLGNLQFNQLISDTLAGFQTVSLEPGFSVKRNSYITSDSKIVMYPRDSFHLVEILKYGQLDEDSMQLFRPGNYYINCSGAHIVVMKNKYHTYLEDLVLYHVIDHNISRRPVFFTGRGSIPDGLSDFWVQKGRLYEIKCDHTIPRFDHKAALDYFGKGFHPFEVETLYTISGDKTLNLNYYYYIRLISQAMLHDTMDRLTLVELSNAARNIWHDRQWHYEESLFDLLKTFYKTGLTEEATELRVFLEKAVMLELPKSVSNENSWHYGDDERINYFEYYIQDVMGALDEGIYPEEKKALELLLEKVKNYKS